MFSTRQGQGNANESTTRAAKYLSIGTGSSTIQLPSIATPATAHFNQTAMSFNGSNTAITIKQSSSTNCAASWSATSSNSQNGGTNGNLWIQNTGQVTYEFWVYFNSVSGQIGFLEYGQNGVALGIKSDHTTVFFSQSQVSYGSTFTIPAITTGTWYHMVWQRSQNGLASPQVGFWLNGTSYTGVTNTTTFTGTNPSTGTTTNVTTPWIGGGQGSVFINAYMQEFRISNIARYAPGVNFTPPNAPFVNDPNTLLLIHGTSPLQDDNS